MASHVITNKNKRSKLELDAVTIPAGSGTYDSTSKLYELDGDLQDATNGKYFAIHDDLDHVMSIIKIVGTMPAGSEIVVTGYSEASGMSYPAYTETLGAVTDDTVSYSIRSEDIAAADKVKIVYKLAKDATTPYVATVETVAKKKGLIDDHGDLFGLTDDDHSQYLLLAGRSGQTINDDIVITGDLEVQGTSANIYTTTLLIEDKNIELGVVTTPSDALADGGGITLKGTTDKTWDWVNSTDAWTSSEHVDVASGKEYMINSVSINTGGTLSNVSYLDQDNNYTGEQTITIADTINKEAITINQNDTTNNPSALVISNTGTGSSIAVNTNEFLIEGDGTLSVAGVTNYEALVTDDDDIPNKKYVDDFSSSSSGTTSNTFTIDSDSTDGKIILDVANGGTDHSVTITNSVTTGDIILTIPNATGNLAVDSIDNTFTAEQTITIADTINTECLTLVQNDTTNNPAALVITNTGTGDSINVNSGDFLIDDEGNVETKGDIHLTNTTNANQEGIIRKNGDTFIHDFNYGNNGTVTTDGCNFFAGEDAGNLTMGATATFAVHSSRNTGGGYGVLQDLTVGYNNTATGANCGTNVNSGFNNTLSGENCCYSLQNGSWNTISGKDALANGVAAGFNTASGGNAIKFITTTNHNVAKGYNAGAYYGASSANTGSSNSVFIGSNTKAATASDTNMIVIGDQAIGLGSNTAVIGNSSITKTELKGNLGLGTDAPNSKLEVKGFVEASSGATAFNRVASLYSNDSTYDQEIHLGVLPTDVDTVLRFAGGDANGTFGKGFLIKHNKTDNQLELGINTGGNIDSDSLDFALVANNFKCLDSGSDSNSSKISFIADSSGTKQTGSIFCAYGANPYLRISAPNNSGTETAVIDIEDSAMTFCTDNTTDIGADGANRPKNIYASGSIKAADEELENDDNVTGNITDNYTAALKIDPGLTVTDAGSYTITRHNYIDVQNISLTETSGTLAVTDGAVMRFDAAAGSHIAVDGSSTKTTPGGVDAWIKVNIDGTIYYMPAYTSKTA